ncbi:neprilysin-1 [Drosophila albomicans]|uniref:Neprilysin-1 n=1 Tax=Drosophila albomicans TaxID=7291 RepID=A0A6P8XAD1_DROAB|nr:neprilysin-1 [Drosophila albomicans]
MRFASASVYYILWALLASCQWRLVTSGVYEGLNINTPLTHEIMRQAKSAAMRSYMNNDAKPCDEFYAYACGNYGRINPVMERVSSDILTTLNDGYVRRIGQLLNEPKMSTDSPTETRVKYFYESCVNTSRQPWNQRPFLIRLLKEFGGMPALEGTAWNASNFDAIEVMARLLKRFGKVTLINVEVSPGLSNTQINKIYLGQHSGLASKLSDQLKLQQSLEHLLGLSKENARKTAAEITELNAALLVGVVESSEKLPPGQMNHLRLLDEMTESYGQNLNLTQFVRSWLGNKYLLPVYHHGESYMWQLKKLLGTTPKRILANYLLSSLLNDFKLVPCAEKTAEMFPDFVDHMVYRSLEKQNPHIPGSLRHLWQELKVSFEKLLRSPSANWLDEQTLGEALLKLKSMSFSVRGADAPDFEKHYASLVISTADYFGNVQRVLEMRGRHLRDDLERPPNFKNYNKIELSPFYALLHNQVVIPASHMQHRYLFDDAYPMALKYGTVGYLLAHEMVHGFDDLASSLDAQGNLRDWWQKNTTEQFEQRKQCLVQQFSAITYNGKKLPRMKLQSENIADNAGVRIAHAAYVNWLQQQPTVDSDSETDSELLPRLSLTSEQLFFLALGQMSCSELRPERREAAAFISDGHAPNEVRVNAIMSNFDGFATAYKCPQGTPMNPTEKCVIY